MRNRFELFRLSLLERNQLDFFGYRNYSRADWLKKVFSQELGFTFRGTEYFYSPSIDDSDDSIITGRIGRHVLREENLPPENGLGDVTRDTWLAAVIVLDPTEHPDGQKLAVQAITSVGQPLSLVKHLTQSINDLLNGPFEIEPSRVVEAQSFWKYVKQNRNNITSVSFDFIAPNMLGADDEFHDEMREFKSSEKAKKVKLEIQNDEGINPETDRIKRAVNYALSESKGSVRARAKGRPSYNSNNEAKHSYLDGVKGRGVEFVKLVKEYASKVLGRE